MSSGLPLKADIAQYGQHVSKVPIMELSVITNHVARQLDLETIRFATAMVQLLINKKPGTRPGLGLFQDLKLDQYFATTGPTPLNLYDTPARTTSMVWRPP
jgi:hypothetical protein